MMIQFKLIIILALALTASAQDDRANFDTALRILQNDLKLKQNEADKLKSEMAQMVPKSDVRDAEAATAKAVAKIAELEKELKTSQAQVAKLQTAADASKAEASKAKAEVASLEKELSHVKVSFKMADSEALQLRKKAERAERALEDLKAHHHRAWLPHWLDETVGKYGADAHVALSKSASASKDAIQRGSAAAYAHGAPLVGKAAEVLKTKMASGIAAGSKHLEQRGIKLPASVVAAKDSAQRAVKAALSSNAAATAVDALRSAGVAAHKHAGVVVAELENVIVQASKSHPSLGPLAEKPLSTMAVYFVLCLPLLAIGMPLLASRRPKVAQSEASSERRGGASGGNRTPGQKSSAKKSGGRGRY